MPGQRYSLTEIDLAGWEEGPITCTVTPVAGAPVPIPDVTDFALDAGDRVACEVDDATAFLSAQNIINGFHIVLCGLVGVSVTCTTVRFRLRREARQEELRVQGVSLMASIPS